MPLSVSLLCVRATDVARHRSVFAGLFGLEISEVRHRRTLAAYRRELDRRLDRLLTIEPDTEAGCKFRRGIEKCRDKLFVFVSHPRCAANSTPYRSAACAPR